MNLFLHSALFLLWTYAVLYVPGYFLLRSYKSLTKIERAVLSFCLGLVVYAMSIYALGYAGLFQWTVLALLFPLYTIAVSGKDPHAHFFELVRSVTRHKLLIVFLIIGVAIQMVQMVGSGLISPQGMPFFRVHAQDGIFHLALIASITRHFPPQEPGMYGMAVQNYHYWSDMVIAHSSMLTKIPIHELFFQFFPPFVSLLTALALIALTQKLSVLWNVKNSQTLTFFALFFLFFGSDLSYLFMLKNHGIWGFYTSAIDNGATQFLNTPHTFAKLVFFCSLILYSHWVQEKKHLLSLYLTLLVASLFGFKIYFALLFGAFLGFEILQKYRQWKRFFLLGVGMVAVSLLVYLPPNKGSGGLSWYPLEWVKLMLSRENLDLTNFNQKWAIAQYYGLTWKVRLYEVAAIIVTLLAIHGSRVLGFFYFVRSGSADGRHLYRSLALASIVFTFLGLTTLQVSGGFNVFNFFASSLSVLALYSAFLCARLWGSRNVIARILVVCICLVTLPRIIYETHKIVVSYRDGTDVTWVNHGEMEALRYIQEQTPSDSLILTNPENTLDFHTPYVSYFSNRFTYASGVSVLETHNQNGEGRLQELKNIWYSTAPAPMHQWLVRQGIDFVYTDSVKELPFDPKAAGLYSVFENADARIYAVEKNI